MPTPRQPQDRKPKVGDFTHRVRDHTVTLPALSSLLTFGFSRTHRHLPEEEQMYLLIEEHADEETLALLDTMDFDETLEFARAWRKHSDVDTGESGASSSS